MDVEIEKVDADEKEMLLIRCHEISEEVKEIAAFARARQGRLSGILNERQYEVPYSEIYYIESVDGRTFLYVKDNVYEVGYRIYELEAMLKDKYFLRVSKAIF